MSALRRIRGSLAWHLAKPWIGAIHDKAKAQVDELERDANAEDFNYRVGVAVGKVSGARRLRDAMWHGEPPEDLE